MVPDSATPWTVPPRGSSVHGMLQARMLEGLQALLQGIFPIPGANPHHVRLPRWQAGSLPLVPPGKPFQLVREGGRAIRHKPARLAGAAAGQAVSSKAGMETSRCLLNAQCSHRDSTGRAQRGHSTPEGHTAGLRAILEA